MGGVTARARYQYGLLLSFLLNTLACSCMSFTHQPLFAYSVCASVRYRGSREWGFCFTLKQSVKSVRADKTNGLSAFRRRYPQASVKLFSVSGMVTLPDRKPGFLRFGFDLNEP